MIRFSGLLALVLTLALGGFAWAEKNGTSDAPKEKSRTHQVTGHVASLADDQQSVVLTVRRGGDENKQVTVQLASQTKYLLDGKTASLQDVLKVGQKVHVTTNDAQPPVAIKIKAIDEEKEKEKKEQRKQEKEKAKQEKAPTTAPADGKE